MHQQTDSSSLHYDVVIIGAGIIGAATAYQVTKRYPAKKVLLLEQFDLLHESGGSHGNSRIFRLTYTHAIYSAMAKKSLQLWREAEHEAGMQVLHRTGGLDFGAPTDASLKETINVCSHSDISHEILNGEQINERYPALNVPKDYIGLYHSDAGILNARECVRMYLELARKNGCHIRANEKLIEYGTLQQQQQQLVRIRTNKDRTYTAAKVIICAGSWSQKILTSMGATNELNIPALRFQVWKCSFAFWPIARSASANYKLEKLPIWIHFGDEVFYGFPEFERPGTFKASIHYSDEHIDPDKRTFTPAMHLLEQTREFVKKHFRGVDTAAIESLDKLEAHTCLYNVSTDENFVLDTHPANPNICIFSGDSGHAFKFAPVIGAMMAQSACEGHESVSAQWDLSLFSLKRLLPGGEIYAGPTLLRDRYLERANNNNNNGGGDSTRNIDLKSRL